MESYILCGVIVATVIIANASSRLMIHIISLSLVFPLSGVRCCLQFFSPPHLLFFSTLLCLILPVSLLSCLLHISLNTVLPSQPWPPSSPPALVTYSAALFGSLSSAILSTCPAHCNLLLTSLSVKLLCTPVCPRYSCYFSDPVVFAHLQPLLLQFGQSQGFRSVQACWCDTSSHSLALQSF